MFHKGMTGRTDENGPASVKNDIGKRGGQDLYLRDYITRKQESDALFTGESMTTTLRAALAEQAAGQASPAYLAEPGAAQATRADLVANWPEHNRARMTVALHYAAPAAEQAEPSGETRADLYNALQRIDTVACMHPLFKVEVDGGLDACVENIVRLIERSAAPHAPARQEPLTDAQIAATYKQLTDKARQTGNPKFGSVLSLARAVERAHGITAAPAEGGAA